MLVLVNIWASHFCQVIHVIDQMELMVLVAYTFKPTGGGTVSALNLGSAT